MMAQPIHHPLRGELLNDEPMARHTTWRVGGPADRYFRPADIEDLARFLAELPMGEPLFWLGLGSNILVRDGGIRGTVVATSGRLNEIERLDGNRLRVEAGVSCARVARFAAAEELGGAEFLAGIPGTMGGALAMNAGCFDGETWRLVVAVETVDRHGCRHHRLPAEYQIGYRTVDGPEGEYFVAAELQLNDGSSDQARQRIRELLDRRSATQPTGQANAGSVFRNPPGDFAARLIESCGLKGHCIGGACVSEKHANFIINLGKARAADIEALINEVAEIVYRQRGVRLQREVKIIGEGGNE